MSNIRIELDYQGVGELLKSQELSDLIGEIVDDIKGRCGEGYESDIQVLSTRVVGSVYTDTNAAIKDNLNNNTILRSLGND